MGGNKKDGGGKAKKDGGFGALKREDVLQAVVLADSFTQTRFRPVTYEMAKVLMPLVNVPMLNYTLEFLVSGGVREIFVFCRAHAADVRAYIEGSEWPRQVSIRIIVGAECQCAGDALRHIDTLDVITGDFVLISGDVVTNIKLADVLRRHKARVAADKRNVMTVVMKKANPTHRTRTLDDHTVVGVCADTAQLLAYENDADAPGLTLDAARFDRSRKVRFRFDLMDTYIDVCTPDVLMLFTDNFDWSSRVDFFSGVLGSEILGQSLFVHVISGEYAARLLDWRTYDSISRDVIHRWTYPMVCDNNLVSADTRYTYARGNKYRERDVKLARSCTLGVDTVLGARTSVGKRSALTRCVVGRDCVIGDDCEISDCYVWANVTLGNGVKVGRAVICHGARVGDGVVVGRGCVVAPGVHVAAGTVVPEYTLLTTRARSEGDAFGDGDGDGDDAKATQAAADEAGVGKGGIGRVYAADEGSEDESEDDSDDDSEAGDAADDADDGEECDGEDDIDDEGDPAALLRRLRARRRHWRSTWTTLAPQHERYANVWRWARLHEDDDEWFDGDGADDEPAAGLSFGADADLGAEGAAERAAAAAGDGVTGDGGEARAFYSEVVATLRRGNDDDLPLDAVQLEVASLKLSHDASLNEYVTGFFYAIFSLVGVSTHLLGDGDDEGEGGAAAGDLEADQAAEAAAATAKVPPKAHLAALSRALNKWTPVLRKFVSTTSDAPGAQAAGQSPHTDQAAVMMALEALCAAPTLPARARCALLFPYVLQRLYEKECLEEEAILKWEARALAATDDDKVYSANVRGLLKGADTFLTWLKEASEDDDDEEDESEEED